MDENSVSSIEERLQLLIKQREWINQLGNNHNPFIQKRLQLEEQKKNETRS